MTTGQLVFYGGLALLGLTVLAVIVFLIKKPVYKPENSVYEGAADGRTLHLRNGYPTERETVRRDSSERTGSVETEAFDEEADSASQETEILDSETEVLSQEPEIHDDKTDTLFQNEDTPLDGSDQSDDKGKL